MEKTNNLTSNQSEIAVLAKIIQASTSLVFFGGAGVSTESGIPDFRSSQGLYQKPNTYDYPAEYLLSHTCFKEDPKAFFHYYLNEMIYPQARPNKAHKALADLERLGYCKAIITQNIDGLHQVAGSKQVYELHGSVHQNTCVRCKSKYTLEQVLDISREKIQHGYGIPTCSCSGVIKPDVVLYEEALSEVVITKAIEAISKADVLIVGGTSLRVYPAAGFLRYFKGKHLILINQEVTSFDQQADLIFRQPIGEVLGGVMHFQQDDLT